MEKVSHELQLERSEPWAFWNLILPTYVRVMFGIKRVTQFPSGELYTRNTLNSRARAIRGHPSFVSMLDGSSWNTYLKTRSSGAGLVLWSNKVEGP